MVTNKIRITTDALVIKEMSIGESDKLLTLLSKDYGVIKAFSSGSKKINSKKFSASSLLTYANFSLVKTGDTYKIYEASTITSFFTAGQDISVLSLAQYFCELSMYLAPSEMPAVEFLRLILNSLDQIVNKKRDLNLIKTITEIRAISLAGYTPNLIACAICANFDDDKFYFNVQSGEIFCNNCKTNSEFERAINKTHLDALRHVVFSDFSKIYYFDIPSDDAKYLSLISEEYVILHCEHKFSTLSFYKSISD